MARTNRSKLTFANWLKSLPNVIIWKLANEWRRDVKRTTAIHREYARRLKKEASRGKV